MRVSTGWSKTALALAAAVLAVNVYRAATQSITTDEAYTYNRFVDAPGREGVLFYDANNHVLHTLAVRASVAAFGVSEFTVRLPALLGGALYLGAAWVLCGYVFGESWLALLCLGMLALNPFVLDYLSASRGYGMALGLLLLALERMVRYLAEGGEGKLYAAGVALGLAAAANLVFAVPAAALGLVFGALVLRRPERVPFWTLVDRFPIPGVVVAFAILVVPLSHAEGGAFYYGAETLAEMAGSLVRASLTAPVPGLRGEYGAVVVLSYMPVAYGLGAALAAAGAWVCGRALRARRRPDAGEALAALAGGGMALAVAALVAARHLAGVRYPMDRTGVYWVPLAVVAVCALARRRRAARVVVGGLALAALVQFALLFRVNYYGAWHFDAGTSNVIAALRAREKGGHRVRLAASWEIEPTLNFYRRMYRLDWLEPVDRDGPNRAADYHVLIARDAGTVEKLGLKVLYRDPVSGALLAR